MAGEKMMREDQQQAVLFAAGIAALMACFENAVIGVWAFLALNLLLLAILLTSKSLIQSDKIDEAATDFHGFKVVCRKSKVPVEAGSAGKLSRAGGDCVPMECVEHDAMEDGEDEVSKEELNQRVEAFIARFRRQLVSDHVKSRSLEVQW